MLFALFILSASVLFVLFYGSFSSMFEKGTLGIAREENNASSSGTCTLRWRRCNALWMRSTIIVVCFRVISALLDIRGMLRKGSELQKRIVRNRIVGNRMLSVHCWSLRRRRRKSPKLEWNHKPSRRYSFPKTKLSSMLSK